MRILFVHNYYQQPGGEDGVFADEAELLRAHGHGVLRYTQHNDAIRSMNRLALAGRTLWNRRTYRDVRVLLDRERPDLVHLHNTFPLVSPSVIHAARAAGVAVVQTVPNYRLVCPNAQLLRNGKPCEDCAGQTFPWPGLVHACYRGDRLASAAVAVMLSGHRILRTWSHLVDIFITPTVASQRLVAPAVAPAEVVVKPNFVEPDPRIGNGAGGYALFVGRLSPEKGIHTLLQALKPLDEDVTLNIAGTGPLEPAIRDATARDPRIHWLGWQGREQVMALLRDAALLVFPSLWYEGMPRTILEAFATGTPVVASDLGGMSELVDHGRTGLRFAAGDPADLAAHIRWALQHPQQLAAMRVQARREYEGKYTGAINYAMLMECYARALARARSRQPERRVLKQSG